MFRGCRREDMPPHIFAAGQQAYRNMMVTRNDQSLILMGLSGSGKTFNARYLLRYLAAIGQTEKATVTSKRSLLINTVSNGIWSLSLLHSLWLSLPSLSSLFPPPSLPPSPLSLFPPSIPTPSLSFPLYSLLPSICPFHSHVPIFLPTQMQSWMQWSCCFIPSAVLRLSSIRRPHAAHACTPWTLTPVALWFRHKFGLVTATSRHVRVSCSQLCGE